VGQWRRRIKSKSAKNRNKSKVSQKSCQYVSQKPASQLKVFCRPQLAGSVGSSKVVPVSRKPKKVESLPETSQSAGSALAVTIRWLSGVIEGSPSQPKSETSRKSARSRDNQSARNQPVSRKCQNGSVSQKPASHLEVPRRPRVGGKVASSKEVQVRRKAKQVESQPEVEIVSQPETSQSAGSSLAATNRWVSGVVERSPSQPKTEQVES